MHATGKTTAFYAMRSAEEAMLGRSSHVSGNARSSDTTVKRIKVSGDAQKGSGDALADDKLYHASGKARLKSILKKGMLSGNERGMKCTIDGTVYPSFTEKTWFGDSGASCHIDYEDEDMFDVVYIDEVVGGIGDQLLRATKKGKKRVKIQQADGSSMEKVLNPVKYCAKAKEKLFSITRELSEGAKLASDANNNIILLYDDGTKIVFDRRIKTRDGWVGGVHISPVVDETVNVATVATKTVVQYHRELGHPSEMTTRSTAKARGEKLGGTFTQCKECVLSKAKQKKVSKDSVERSKTPGGRLFIDISSPKTKSIGGSKHWLLVVDDCSD
eukprot:926952_1